MNKQAECVKETNLDVTICKTYVILDEDKVINKVKIIDDKGTVVWVDTDCFRF